MAIHLKKKCFTIANILQVAFPSPVSIHALFLLSNYDDVSTLPCVTSCLSYKDLLKLIPESRSTRQWAMFIFNISKYFK